MILKQIGKGAISVMHNRAVLDALGGYRQEYTYVITAADWTYSGSDLHSGVGDLVNEAGALQTLADFLHACAESRSYGNGASAGENADLFPDHVGAWAQQYSDELGLLAAESDD